MAAKDELGMRGERLAERHLLRRGLTLLDRNWRCAQGEIDLVAGDRRIGGGQVRLDGPGFFIGRQCLRRGLGKRAAMLFVRGGPR